LVAGGRLRVAMPRSASWWSQTTSFANEAISRAGGLAMASAYSGGSRIGEGDVLLVDDLDLDAEARLAIVQQAREAGALVVLFGSEESALRAVADWLIGTGLPAGTAPVVQLDGWPAPLCPLAPDANITALWVFTGELVAACTRLGQTPVLYESVFVPGRRDWFDRHQGARFHSDLTVPAVPAGQLGSTYLAEMRRCVQGLVVQQAALGAAGQLLAGAIRAGGRARVAAIGHHLPGQFGLPGDPGRLDGQLPWTASQNWDIAGLERALAPGDALLFMGYFGLPAWTELDPLRSRKLPSVWVTGGREVPELNPEPRDWEIHIDPLWRAGDSSVELPGYPFEILPPSGVIQTAVLWMITGEVEAAMLPPVTAVETPGSAGVPRESRLLSCYPNPFNATTTIPYVLSAAGPVRLTVYDALGAEVATLRRGWQEAGPHSVTWHPTDCASGVYYCRLSADAVRQTRKLVLSK
ncbi:MAG: T9SS type A sorting domain-containing protein, partial [Candidatus Latescibacterota bacterium]